MILEVALGVLAVAVIWLFVQVGDLRREIDKLKHPTPTRKRVVPAATVAPPAEPDDIALAANPDTTPWPDPDPEPVRPDMPTAPKDPGVLQRGMNWVVENWVLTVAGVSLALAAVFLVQYGIENGLLGPAARVIATVGLGVSLLAAAEYLRRFRAITAGHIPTVFAAAGIVALFVAGFSAHALYGLIGPTAGFAALAAVAILGTFGGWLYGPFLSALSLIGGFAVPFIVASPDQASAFVYVYPVTLAVMAMLIDSLRGWVWVSAVGIIGGFASVFLFQTAGIQPEIATLAYTAIVLTAPFALYLSFRPAPDDVIDWPALIGNIKQTDWSALDLRVGIITATATLGSAGLLFSAEGWSGAFQPALWCLVVVLVLYGLILHRATALAAVTWIAAVTFGLLFLFSRYSPPIPTEDARRLIEYPFLMILAGTIGLVGLLIWRTSRAPQPLAWALVTGIAPAIVVFALQVNWAAAAILSDWGWALHVMALAGTMTVGTAYLARHPHVGIRPAAYLALSAMGLMAYGLFVVLSGAALTMALAVAMVAAAWLDRRFDLRPTMLFLVGAAAMVSGRIFAAPGHLYWAEDFEFALLTLIVLPAFWAAFVILRGRRVYPGEVVLVGLITLGVTMFGAAISRINDALGWDDEMIWGFIAIVLPVILGFFGQIYLAQRAEFAKWIRIVLASLFGVVAAFVLPIFLIISPLLANEIGAVKGVVLLNTATVAYQGVTVAILVGLRFVTVHRWLQWISCAVAGAYALVWLMIQVRMLFHTTMPIDRSGFVQPELYTYTVLMLIGAAGLLYQSVARQSAILRRVALGLLALTIAKVFLVDITELSGLFRVLAFLVLGLSLAGIAWLDGWLARRSAPIAPASAQPDPPEPDA